MDNQKAGTILNRNPMMFFLLVQSGIALAVTFGLSLTADQTGAILTFTTILLSIITNTMIMPISQANAKISEALNSEPPKADSKK